MFLSMSKTRLHLFVCLHAYGRVQRLRSYVLSASPSSVGYVLLKNHVLPGLAGICIDILKSFQDFFVSCDSLGALTGVSVGGERFFIRRVAGVDSTKTLNLSCPSRLPVAYLFVLLQRAAIQKKKNDSSLGNLYLY